MARPPTSLKGWLRMDPRPVALRLLMPDGEWRPYPLKGGKGNHWATTEKTILAMGCEVVECLDAKGQTIRAQRIEDTEEIKGEHERERLREDLSREISGREQSIARTERAMALVLDRYGDRLNEAFERGAAAASVSQDNLVAMVESLMAHWTAAITNLHTVSVNLATALQGQEPPDPGTTNQALIAQVLGLAAAKAMGPKGADAPNGDGKGGKER